MLDRLTQNTLVTNLLAQTNITNSFIYIDYDIDDCVRMNGRVQKSAEEKSNYNQIGERDGRDRCGHH